MAFFVLSPEGRFLKREGQEDTNTSFEFTDSRCMRLYSCPKTPPKVVFFGDREKGEAALRRNYFTDVCRYLRELIQCGNDLNIEALPECNDERNLLLIIAARETSMCKNPIFPLLQGLQQCMNSRYQQLDRYRKEVIALMESTRQNPANNEMSKNLFCRSYSQLLDITLQQLESCNEIEFQWTSENIETFRHHFYPAIIGEEMNFQCPDPAEM
ncbi:uncharacterized protein LOC134244704 [Saccostrea cucullata]|uniref:uncharacterized protein LOC134244704 n=1 Tax=Saccostrea cuccullata TaxID=36930 RepID=UPI002ED28402